MVRFLLTTVCWSETGLRLEPRAGNTTASRHPIRDSIVAEVDGNPCRVAFPGA